MKCNTKCGVTATAEATRAYLVGKMSGEPNNGFPPFRDATRELRADGWDIVSPVELDEQEGITDFTRLSHDEYRDVLLKDLSIVADPTVKCLIALPGWEESYGANAEVAFARALGKPVYLYPDLTPVTAWRATREPGHIMREVETRLFAQNDDAPSMREVRVTDPDTGGEKGQKLAQLGALDPTALIKVAEVAGFGAQKYERLNFMKGYAWSLSYDALQRHLLAYWAGADLDGESGQYHLAHAAWHCLALLAFSLHNLGTDDRWEP